MGCPLKKAHRRNEACMKPTLSKNDVLYRLTEHWPAIHTRGVHRLGRFGSFARDGAPRAT